MNTIERIEDNVIQTYSLSYRDLYEVFPERNRTFRHSEGQGTRVCVLLSGFLEAYLTAFFCDLSERKLGLKACLNVDA